MSVSSQYSSDNSWYPYGIGCSGDARYSLGWQGHPLCHDFCIFLPWCVSCGGFQSCLAEPSGVTVCGLGTCVLQWGACYRRQKSLTR